MSGTPASTPARPSLRRVKPRVLVTGGCGFLGSNIADALAERGRDVLVLDSLARRGAEENRDWLRGRHRDRVAIEIADVRDGAAVKALVAEASAVLHLAAQVAVTTSLAAPVEDFAVNGAGTLNVLEAVRTINPAAPVVFASTNKVYGRLLADDAVCRTGARYAPVERRFANGVSEDTPLDFYSPYGCSKGTADQYVHDYGRVFGLKTVVLRMSCIYGPRQFGTEDQGWLAHFLLQAILGRPITIFGDGCQVRDALFVDDAVAAWLAALDGIEATAGRVFNLGGGPAHSISLRELLAEIAHLRGEEAEVRFAPWRPGDQPWYVSDIRAIGATLGWAPKVGLPEGVAALHAWLANRFGAKPAKPVAQGAKA